MSFKQTCWTITARRVYVDTQGKYKEFIYVLYKTLNICEGHIVQSEIEDKCFPVSLHFFLCNAEDLITKIQDNNYKF